MGKGIKAGKAKKQEHKLSEWEVDQRIKKAEAQFNQELKSLQQEWKRDYDRGLEVTYHNNSLWAQVILYVALKREFGFGSKRMVRVARMAEQLVDNMICDAETFCDLKDELYTVGLEVEEDLEDLEDVVDRSKYQIIQ